MYVLKPRLAIPESVINRRDRRSPPRKPSPNHHPLPYGPSSDTPRHEHTHTPCPLPRRCPMCPVPSVCRPVKDAKPVGTASRNRANASHNIACPSAQLRRVDQVFCVGFYGCLLCCPIFLKFPNGDKNVPKPTNMHHEFSNSLHLF